MNDDYVISDIYQGNPSKLNPNYVSYAGSLPGIHTRASSLGTSVNPTVANQVAEVSRILNQGIIPIEVGTLDPKTLESMPKTQMDELRRLANLAGAKLSMHAPIQGVDAAGFSQQGWSEDNRINTERMLMNAVNRAAQLSDKDRVSVTVHSSGGVPGAIYKMVDGKKQLERGIVVDKETGKLVPIEEKIKYYPHLANLEKGKIPNIKDELETLNHTEWDNAISTAMFTKENADKILESTYPIVQRFLPELVTGELKRESLNPTDIEVFERYKVANQYIENTQQSVNALFNQAYTYGDKDDRESLKELSEAYRKNFGIKDRKELEKLSEDEQKDYAVKTQDAKFQSQAMSFLLTHLKRIVPEKYQLAEEFVIKNASKTFANVAFNTYEKFKDKPNLPMINVENMYPDMVLFEGEQMENLILESRNKFVELAKQKGYSEGEAKSQAEKMLGVTLDLGHLNIGKKHGYKDKDLVKEAEKIAKYVKHVHLADNFGFEDSHLPPGMGDVPNKQILEMLQKKGFDGTKIIEAGGFINQFKESPFVYSLEAMGSPLYSMKMGPYWSNYSNFNEGYLSGYGTMLPQTNYQMFGAGFSQLPGELGGQVQGAGGNRMSGRPME